MKADKTATVISRCGSVGKSTLAANMLMPRMPGAKFYSIETINSGAEMDGIEVEKLKGKNFGQLSDAMLELNSSIIDVGATNFEDFMKLMQQFNGSQEDFGLFIVPVVKDEKCQRDTVLTLRQLKTLGIPKNRIRVLFNRVEVDDDIEHDFSAIFGLCDFEKCAVANKHAVVYNNEIFDRIKSFGKPLGAIVSDETDYRAKLREAKTVEEKENYIAMIQLKRLAISANKNLDDAYAALMKQ